jgi:hypothetical protein
MRPQLTNNSTLSPSSGELTARKTFEIAAKLQGARLFVKKFLRRSTLLYRATNARVLPTKLLQCGKRTDAKNVQPRLGRGLLECVAEHS